MHRYVFFLGVAEVEEGLAGKLDGAEAARRVAVRRRVWETTLRQQGPKFLKGWDVYQDRPAAAANATQLQGIAASPGVAEGVARIIYDVRELSSVKDGEILITRQTDPSWTTVFGRIAGLVLETGGVLSHGTSLCREYGLHLRHRGRAGHRRIKDGQRIELLGGEGVIRLKLGPHPGREGGRKLHPRLRLRNLNLKSAPNSRDCPAVASVNNGGTSSEVAT